MSKNKLKVIMIASAFSMISFSFFSQSSFAQNAIAPDNTLPVNTSVDFNSVDKTYTITGGTQSGANQFHSFQNFSVPTSNTAHFNNSAQTTNVIGRITGSNISDIDGLIKANGAANLYLINPNGFLFGKNAKLEIGGSFSASTATSLKFPDGSEFSATNPQSPPVLTVNVPLGLQYGVSNTGATITNQANLVTGQDLILNADKLDLQGQLQAGRDLTLKAQDRIQIRDTSISPFVAAAGRDLLVQGNQSVDIFALNNRQSGLFSGGNMLLRSPNSVIGDVHYYAGGNFKIEQLDGSLGNLESPNDPIIRSAGDVTFGLYQGSSLHILAGGRVNIGTVIIFGADTIGNTINPTNTPTLANVTLSNGETLTINGSTRPTLDIRAGMNPSDIGITGITGTGTFTDPFGSFLVPPPSTNLASTGTGITVGDIAFFVPNGIVLLTNNYKPNTSLASENITITGTGLFGQIPGLLGVPSGGIYAASGISNGGNVFIDSQESINVAGGILVNSNANGGNVTLLANNNIQFGDNFLIGASSLLKSGKIDIKAGGLIFGKGLSILSESLGSSGTSGNSGDINITAASLFLTNSSVNPSLVKTSTSGTANAGNITLNISGNATFDGVINNNFPTQVVSSVSQGATGNGGIVKVNAGELNLQSGAQINSVTEGLGKSGDVDIIANTVSINGVGSAINNQVRPTANANGGKLTLNVGTLNVTNEGQISTLNSGNGNAGELRIIATGDVIFDRSTASSSINLSGVGKGGDLFISARTLQLLNGAQVGAGVFGIGDGGKITIQADAISLSGKNLFGSAIATTVERSTAIGNAGDIDLKTRLLTLTDGAFISAANNGKGNTGNIDILATESVVINDSSLDNFINRTGQGNGGNLSINSPSISLGNGSKISVKTFGLGNAGNLNLFTQSLSLSNSSTLEAFTDGVGNAGNINIAPSLSTSPISNTIILDGSLVSVSVNPNAKGNGGDLSITTNSLQILNGAQIAAGVFGKGDGGQIRISSDTIKLDGKGIVFQQNVTSGIFTSVESNAMGNAGSLDVRTRNLEILNSAVISATTEGIGNAGKIVIRASDAISLNNGSIRSNVNATGQGDGGNLDVFANTLRLENQSDLSASTASANRGGNITVTSNSLEIAGGSQLRTTTSSSGAAGNISLFLTDLLKIDGTDSGIFAGTTSVSTGRSGTIFIDPELVTLTNGAKISVSSLGKGNGGNIQLIAGLLSLDTGSQIIAETASGEGGNIVLQVRDLLWLRNGSLISATAGNDGNGGNIDLSANFILAFAKDNSDITANAFKGKGGNIRITTQAIFGMQFRPRLTPLSDITASSDFGVNGTVNINTPGVDPSKGLTNLPVDIGDASKLVSQKCLADRQDSAFVITGRGGIPASPADVISGNNLQENLGAPTNPERIAETSKRTINPYGEVAVTESLQTVPTSSWARQLHSNQTHDLPDRIVEAQGWTINPYGEVSLVAEVPKAIAAPTWARQLQCR
ncbi:filamentous hemagglutinin N-terminal domain-containing protein [Phormidium tenue]|uniref:Filamentous hemagglutinin N-terminal domain-containing protein n=2 Tax=Phormidium tenue TaxID=126344 RepID=A0ABR8CDR7_9CYAN|nr:filamentous hemagglutinin N-terminal domain-containing protein [Phormidium tenue FACHB-1050]